MKKIISIIVLCTILLSTLSACGNKKKDVDFQVDKSLIESDTTKAVTESTVTIEKVTEKATQKPTEKVVVTECSHQWTEADCSNPKTCSKCLKTDGTLTAHNWLDATCANAKTCSTCGETSGISLSHNWTSATCTAPRTCAQCGETSGESNGHNWKEATFEMPKTCSKCQVTEGSPRDASTLYQLQINTPLPAEFNYYDSKNQIVDTVNITDVTYKFEPSNYSDDAKLIIYFSGVKTYDKNGSGQSRSSKVSLKLFDSEDFVIDDKTFYSPSLALDEAFKNEEAIFYNIEPGSYKITLTNTN